MLFRSIVLLFLVLFGFQALADERLTVENDFLIEDGDYVVEALNVEDDPENPGQLMLVPVPCKDLEGGGLECGYHIPDSEVKFSISMLTYKHKEFPHLQVWKWREVGEGEHIVTLFGMPKKVGDLIFDDLERSSELLSDGSFGIEESKAILQRNGIGTGWIVIFTMIERSKKKMRSGLARDRQNTKAFVILPDTPENRARLFYSVE